MTDADGSTDRLVAPGRFRLPRAAVGAAVLSLSMLLTVAPVLGAGNNGNGNGNSSAPPGNGTSGNVKVNDATTGIETSGTDNEPHVCAFWLSFTFDAPFEAGTWVVVSWAPTGDGSTVASGVYDTTGDGVDSSGVIEVAAGHYRVEWAATGATSSKKKTFWVDAGCDAPGSPADEESQVEEEPVTEELVTTEEEASQAEEPAPPTDPPGSPAEEESQAEEAPVTEEFVLSEEGTAPSQDEPQAEDAAPTDVAEEEEPAQAVGQSSSESGTLPSRHELGAVGGSDEPTMSDTAVPAVRVNGGLFGTIGLLALLVLSTGPRRDRRSDRDNSVPAA